MFIQEHVVVLSSRMAIVLTTFTLAGQEILDLLYFALLLMNDQTELNSLVAKNAVLHREYHTAYYARVDDTNNEKLVLLLSLLLVEFAKVGLCVTNAFPGFAKLNATLIAALKMGEAMLWPMKISDRARLSFFQTRK